MNFMKSRMQENIKKYTYLALIFIFILAPCLIIYSKIRASEYSFDSLFPAVSYQVDLRMTASGHGDDIQIKTYLPKSDGRQNISKEENSSQGFNYSVIANGLNRVGIWQADAADSSYTIRNTYSVQARHYKYEIPKDHVITPAQESKFKQYLAAEEGIQVNDDLIKSTITRLFNEGNPSFYEAAYTIHRYLQVEFKNKKFSGYTDAITALKLGEASCNGKSRLFVALARSIGIPARLVGGVILNTGSKKTSHQWVELYLNGYWIPFDTINDHFAELPSNYLALYYGDQVLFSHTSNINFDYKFTIRKQLVPRAELQESLDDSSLNIANIYSLFEKIGISQNLLKILLMIPIGALVVVIFRNIIGLETFGTFLPALIAAAARETGLLWGLAGFFVVIMTVSSIRKLLDWLQLLHSPKMAIMLTSVVVIMLLMTSISVNYGLVEVAHISLFPIAILAITAERFAIVEVEQGLKKACTVSFATCVVIAAAYTVMDSVFLQSVVVAFPESLLVIIAINLWLGRWIGMRVMEYFRFRHLIRAA